MARPSSRDLPNELREAAEFLARVLKREGFQAWIVGGAVRDLVVGNTPHEIDLTTDALPERVEALFEHTTAVGKAFGTIVVHLASGEHKLDVEVTTFRADGQYADGRRPEEVTYGSSAEEDARRRDFTCNALYLDPLTDDFLDPEQGLEDLTAGRLDCVGEPAQRFAEDGLRLLRMARFAARLDLTPTEEVLAAAKASAESLRGVSSERVLAEFLGMFRTPRPALAVRLLTETGLLEPALHDEVPGGARTAQARELAARRAAAFQTLGAPIVPALGLALLLDPDPLGDDPDRREGALQTLEALHPSRKLRNEVRGTWMLMDGLADALKGRPRRAARLRMMRSPHWTSAVAASRAWLQAFGASGARTLDDLERERAELGEADLAPPALLGSADLAASGVARGPLWGSLLEEAETLQLELELRTRDQALAWLARRADELT